MSLVPTATSTGRARCRCSRVNIWREPRMQAASASRSDLVCRRRRGTAGPADRSTSASEGASSASAMLSGSRRRRPGAAEPAETPRAPAPDAPRQKGGDARAHRIAHDVGARDAEMIEQRAHVVRHLAGVIVGRIVELGRCAMAAIVERDHAAAGALERRDPARMRPSSPRSSRRSRAPARSARPHLHRDKRSRPVVLEAMHLESATLEDRQTKRGCGPAIAAPCALVSAHLTAGHVRLRAAACAISQGAGLRGSRWPKNRSVAAPTRSRASSGAGRRRRKITSAVPIRSRRPPLGVARAAHARIIASRARRTCGARNSARSSARSLLGEDTKPKRSGSPRRSNRQVEGRDREQDRAAAQRS